MCMSYPVAYLEGIRLFNAGSFWHAHEQWELCWLAAQRMDGMDALFFKGMIQSAAALEKWRRGSLYGMQLNWAKSRVKIDQLPTLYMGLNLVVFRHQMETFVIEQPVANHLAPPQIVLVDPERM